VSRDLNITAEHCPYAL